MWRDIAGEIDEYRLPLLIHVPGLRWSDVDDMPFWLWEQCRDYIDRLNGRE